METTAQILGQGTNEQDKQHREKPQFYTKNYRRLSKAGNERGGSSPGRAHQLLAQCQIVGLQTYIQVTLYQLKIL